MTTGAGRAAGQILLHKVGVVSLTAALASCSADPERVRPLSVGDPAPAIGVPDSVPGLTWVFRKESCLGCGLGPSASEIARVGHRFSGRIAILAVAVGAETDADRTLVETFLQRRRIEATVVPLTARGRARMFGPAPMPSLYLIDQGRVEMAFDLTREEELDSQFVRLRRHLEGMLSPP